MIVNNAIGISVLSGAHMTILEKVCERLDSRDAESVVVFGGGIISDGDVAVLADNGITVFTPGTPSRDIVSWVRANLPPKQG